MNTARLVAVPPALDVATIGIRRLAVAHIGVAVAAFGVASAMAMMQALSRANLELPFRSASMYYMEISARVNPSTRKLASSRLRSESDTRAAL